MGVDGKDSTLFFSLLDVVFRTFQDLAPPLNICLGLPAELVGNGDPEKGGRGWRRDISAGRASLAFEFFLSFFFPSISTFNDRRAYRTNRLDRLGWALDQDLDWALGYRIDKGRA